MNTIEKKLREAHEAVYPGWWPILDDCIPEILGLDPEAQIEVKEKFGTLRIWVGSENVPWDRFEPLIRAAEQKAETICEICGAPGRLRPKQRWIQTLCDQCAQLEPKDRYRLGYIRAGHN